MHWSVRGHSVSAVGIGLLLVLVAVLSVGMVSAQETTPEPAVGRVEGSITNQTEEGRTPVGSPVILYLLEDLAPTNIFTSTVQDNGSFLFEGVPLVQGRTYLATLEYKLVAYGSSLVTYSGTDKVIRLDIDTYEPTTDPSVITVARLHVIVEFTGETMHVSELYIFDNLSDRVYMGVSGTPESGTLELPLPLGVLNPTVERAMGDSMVPAAVSAAAGEDRLRDTLPVRPGTASQQLMVSYDLVYRGSASVSHVLPYAVQGVTLFVPDEGLTVVSDQLTDSRLLVGDGMPYARWDGADLAAGATLAFSLEGEIDAASASGLGRSTLDASAEETQFPLSVAAGDSGLTWGLGAVMLVAAGMAVAFDWFRRRTAGETLSRDSLLRKIAALDSDYEAGRFPPGRYQLERARLKSELRPWYDRE